MRIERVDADPSAANLRDLYDVFAAAQRVDDPHGPPWSYRHFTARATYGWSGEPTEIWLAARDGTCVGGYWITLPEPDNTHLAFLDLIVDPQARRRGVGRTLLTHARERVGGAGRRLLAGYTLTSDAGTAFAAAVGAKRVSEEVRQVLDLDRLDQAGYDGLGDEAQAASAGYTLVRWIGDIPDEYLDSFVELKLAMNDAPVDDMDWDNMLWNSARVRAKEYGYALGGARAYSVAARHDASGALAGYTQILVDDTPDWAFQGDTVVVREHRGHRLGLLMKVAMVPWLREHEPGVRRVVTWNAASNTHMRAVNERLGFRKLDSWYGWELATSG